MTDSEGEMGMTTATIELTEEELFQLFDLVMAHAAGQEMCEKLAITCREQLRKRESIEPELDRFPRCETVLG